MWMKLRAAFPKMTEWIPILNTFLWFDATIRRSALRKFLCLWIISILPLLFAGLLAPLPKDGHQGLLAVYLRAVVREFSSTSLFIYSVSYLAPFVYTVVDAIGRQAKYLYSKKKAPDELRFPDGYAFLLFVSAMVFFLTIAIYKRESGDSIASVIASGPAKWWIYGYSLMCWYVTIMMESDPPESTVEKAIEKQKSSGVTMTADLDEWANKKDSHDHK